jgi:hypothetical protein
MNIKDFIKNKNNCYFCNSELDLIFFSKKKQIFNLSEDKLIVLMDLSLKHKYTYNVSFTFNTNDNSFIVDFYDKNFSKMSKKVPITLMQGLQRYFSYLNSLQIYRSCNICKNYDYVSNDFKLDFKNKTIGDLNIKSESFHYHKKIENKLKIYSLFNDHAKKESTIRVYWDNQKYYNDLEIKTNLIHLNNNVNLKEKIEKIILFS